MMLPVGGGDASFLLQPQATSIAIPEAQKMSIHEFNYKGKRIRITPDKNQPRVVIDDEEVPVSINNKDGFSAIEHLPYSSFSSLEALARKVIDEE